jgi:predicted ATPase/DNA-binding winged helix-turn-helix (wHTH) protein
MAYNARMVGRILALRGCVVDLTERLALREGCAPERLTEREVALLRYLADRAGDAVPVEALERDVWGFAEATLSRAVSATVRRLRPKIEPTPGRPVNLVTVFGVGWRLHLASAVPRAPDGRRAVPDLPARPIDAFVGRAALVDEVGSRIRGGARSVTLVGPGGVGKTRVALEVAHRMTDHFDRVLFVEVDDSREGAGEFPAVATAIGLAALATPEALVTRLRDDGPLLLVLDHRDVAETPSAAGTWLRECPELSVLEVRRVAQGSGTGLTIEVPPLVVPVRGATPEQVAASSAFELLSARALAAGARLDPAADGVAELLAALDGLPLAIELAARRLRMLSPGALLASLDRPEVLVDAAPGRPPRHQSLERTIHASWGAVGESAQRLLSSLAVFEGSFALVDAGAIVDADAMDLVDPLGVLVAHSLLSQRPGPRFAVPRTVRVFVLRHLPPGSERARHARWAIQGAALGAHHRPTALEVERVAELQAAIDGAEEPETAVRAALTAARVLRGRGLAEQALTLARRATELAPVELRAHALSEVIACQLQLGRHGDVIRTDLELLERTADLDPDQAVHTATSVARAHLRSDHMGAAVQRLAPVLGLPAKPRLRARMLRLQGGALLAAGKLGPGLSAIERGIQVALDQGDRAELAWLLVTRAAHAGGLAAVGEAIEAVLAVDDADLEPADRSMLAVSAGSLAWHAGQGREALAMLERGISNALTDGHTSSRRSGLLTMAGVLVDQGRIRAAREALDEAGELVRGSERVPSYRFACGRVALGQGQLDVAEAHLRRAIELLQAGSSAVARVWNHEILAEVRLAQGRYDAALDAARTALGISRGLDASRHAATPLAILGRVELARGELAAAAELAARSCALADRSGIPFDRSLAWLVRGEVAAVSHDAAGVAQARTIVAPLVVGMDIQAEGALATRLAQLGRGVR